MAATSTMTTSCGSDSGGSAGSLSVGGMNGGGSRLRTVKLVKRSGSKLGFSVRGGKEHRTGFFITAIEASSQAQMQGLKVGDQIIRVNGYPVDDATHKELLLLIQGQPTLILKVRSVGMIPVKEDDGDELSWRLVDQEVTPPCNKEDISTIYQSLVLKVPPRAKLGCGICKGPEWKPGIFIQFTKENSIARLGGLRPGDQIIQCNNIPFTPDIPFNQAVSIMRGCGMLELLVCKGAGMELFPGESSGYNSSASSIAGDLPPGSTSLNGHHNNQNCNGNHQVNGLYSHQANGSVPTCKGENGSAIMQSSVEYNGGGPILGRRHVPGSTIIHVNPPAVVQQQHHSISSNGSNSNNNVAEICVVSQQTETKTTTVLVEVHHSEDDNVSNVSQSDASTDRLTNSSVSSFTSSASSLTSAISQELDRRSKKPATVAVGGGVQSSHKGRAPAHPPKEKLLKSGLTKQELDQHEKLMQEFKRAHRKMFNSNCDNGSPSENHSGHSNKEENECSADSEKCLSERILIDSKDVNGNISKRERKESDPGLVGHRPRNKKQPAPPPPPPPMPKSSSESQLCTSTPPTCPTPDYDTVSLASTGNLDQRDSSNTNGLSAPSPLYHSSNESTHTASTVVMRETNVQPCNKPLVTIREYPSGKQIKQPAKFDFLLHNGQSASNTNGHHHFVQNQANNEVPSTARLHNELSQTLARSNLMHQTGPQNGSTDSGMIKSSNGRCNEVSNGPSVIKISIEPRGAAQVSNKIDQNGKQAPFYLFPESQPPAPFVVSNVMAGLHIKDARATTAANNNHNSNHHHPNGILKNSSHHNVSQVHIHHDKMQSNKSIKFGNITTVIRDPEPKG